MSRTIAALVVLSSALVLPPGAFAVDSPSAVAEWIPGNALVAVHISQPKKLIERVFDERVVAQITSLPQYKAAMASNEAKEALNQLKFFEDKFDADLRTLLEKLLGGGITFAIAPPENFLLIVDTEDGELLKSVHDFFLLIARGQAVQQGHPERVTSVEYGDVTGWTFAPGEVHAIVGDRLLIANKPEVLKAALDLRGGAGGSTLADSADYKAAIGAIDDDAIATLYANMSVLKQLPGVQEGLTQNNNMGTSLLFAPLLSAINGASWLTAGVSLEGDELALEIATDGGAAESTVNDVFALPRQAGEGAMPNLTVPRQIAAMSLFRDLHKFYASKDTLFPERTGGIIFFENMMGIFFTGRDLTEEVLIETLPDFRLVIAEQKYDEDTGTPQTQFPGFAVVIGLRDPAKFAPIAEEAWQKAIGLVNFTSGQQAKPGLLIDRPVHGDTKYTTASYRPSDEKDKTAVDVRYNFQPAIATQGDHLILSSTDALAGDLIDAIRKEDAAGIKPLAGKHSLFTMNGSQLASILSANRESMVRQAMVEDGKTRAEAELQWDVIIKVLEHIRSVELDSGSKNGRANLTITIGYEMP